MPSTIIESVLTGKLDSVLLIKWLNNKLLKDVPEDCVLLYCNRSEFVAYFLSYLRKQTDSILQTNSNAHQVLQHQSTPEKLLSSRKHQRSISDPTYEADRSNDSLSVKIDRRTLESPCRERKKTSRKVKTKLFSEDRSRESITNSISSDESRMSSGIDRISLSSSTPIKNGLRLSDYPSLPPSPVTPTSSKSYERCDTPQLKHRHNRSQEKSCLGDYLVTAQRSVGKKKKGTKSVSDDSDIKTDLDLSNSDMFPSLGARKASSLKSDKRRIKPTNIDRNKKSLSLNSFNSDCFQQPSPLALEENAAFKLQKVQPKELSKSFDAERNILRQERQKLMEKFSVLNSCSSPKSVVMPQIKITQKESVEKEQNFTKAEATKVTYKEKLDVLVEIYDALLKNNLILSMNTEIYFLISILLSKQYEDEYLKIESTVNESNLTKYLLKTIHNCTYFAVKSLWSQRTILEVILDKNSLKLLGENKNIRSFYPDLAKFLLNSYGLKCEAENDQTQKEVSEPRRSNGVICFNLETDNVENFPSILSFQNFKKQRDMFYEILRWYSSCGGSVSVGIRGRVKALLCAGAGASSCAHLAGLVTSHLLTIVAPVDGSNSQECKLSKLTRRLTRPAASDSHAMPHFLPEEMFYKELIVCAESDVFRTAMRDALASELCALNAQPLPSTDQTKEYVYLIKRLCLLAKFLGYIASLPYQASDNMAKGGVREPIIAIGQSETAYTAPKRKMLDTSLALRRCSQPPIDLKSMLTEAYEQNRLCIAIPWLSQYLAMLDYTTLRISCYQNLLRRLFDIYTNDLKLTEGGLKNNVIFLKSVLGHLFTLPHFPQELFYERRQEPSTEPPPSVDHLALVTPESLRTLCPHVRAMTSLVTSCNASGVRAAGSFRHITPLSVSGDGKATSEGHLQARLEEAFLKSQPASTRRVLELVTERVCSSAAKDSAKLIPKALDKARNRAAAMLKERKGENQTALLQAMESIYAEELNSLRTEALKAAVVEMSVRSGAALAALAGGAPAQLRAAATHIATNRLQDWIRQHWSTTAILCKDLESELRYLRSVGPSAAGHPHPALAARTVDTNALVVSKQEFESTHVSPALAIIELKEQICLVLEGSPTPSLSRILGLAALAASPNNVFCRPPAQKAILQLSIDLCVTCISHRPADVTDTFLSSLDLIWSVCCGDRSVALPSSRGPEEKRREPSPPQRVEGGECDRAPTPPDSDDDGPFSPGTFRPPLRIVIDKSCPAGPPPVLTPTTPADTASEDYGGLELFIRILCPRNLVLLSSSADTSGSWARLSSVLCWLVRRGYLPLDQLTEQCLALFRQEWDQDTLSHLATCLRTVSCSVGDRASGKMTLFLDLLADYCGEDIDVDTQI